MLKNLTSDEDSVPVDSPPVFEMDLLRGVEKVLMLFLIFFRLPLKDLEDSSSNAFQFFFSTISNSQF